MGRGSPVIALCTAFVVLSAAPVTAQTSAADLVPRDPNWSGDTAFRGRPGALSFALSNQGSVAADGFRVSLHLSDNQLISIVTDPEIARLHVSQLAAGSTRRFAVTATVPADLPIGAYYLGVVANPDQALPESSLVNNIARSTTTIVVRDPGPDFVVSDVQVAAAAAVGEPLLVAHTLTNAGNLNGTVPYELYLSRDSRLDDRDHLVFQTRVDVAVDSRVQRIDRPLVPARVDGNDVEAGLYRVICVLDPDDEVAELDEDNNVLVSVGSVTVYEPRLRILPETPAGRP